MDLLLSGLQRRVDQAWWQQLGDGERGISWNDGSHWRKSAQQQFNKADEGVVGFSVCCFKFDHVVQVVVDCQQILRNNMEPKFVETVSCLHLD